MINHIVSCIAANWRDECVTYYILHPSVNLFDNDKEIASLVQPKGTSYADLIVQASKRFYADPICTSRTNRYWCRSCGSDQFKLYADDCGMECRGCSYDKVYMRCPDSCEEEVGIVEDFDNDHNWFDCADAFNSAPRDQSMLDYLEENGYVSCADLFELTTGG